MSSNAVVRLETAKFRVVELDGSVVWEARDGCDAMGVQRWRKIAIPVADTIAKMYQDYIKYDVLKLPKE